MRILHVYKNYWPKLGGIENHIKVLAESQAARGHDVTILAANTGRRTVLDDVQGVRVVRAACVVSVASTPLSLMLPLWLGRQQPDIMHLHFPYPMGEASYMVAGRDAPMVLSYHSDIVRQKTLLRFYRPLMLRVLARADSVLVATPNYLASSPVLQRFVQKCEIVPYGIDQTRFRAPDPQAADALRQRYGTPLIVFVGVLRYYKGVQYLIEAMQSVPARLLIVGDGPLHNELDALVAQFELGDRVTFVGAIDDDHLAAYYGAADVFCLPACERSEAFGLVQVEALASGTPVVSTELGTGTSYVNLDGESGLVVPPKDPQALSAALRRILSDNALRARLAHGAQTRADLFVADRMVEDVERVYARVLQARGTRRTR